ncbi:MAG: VOC family protein [Rhodospirillales bacterium]|nr:VOC family protein [Rhodospirillales bacterium]
MATQLKDKPDTQPKHDVGGLEMDRPFRIRRLGHFGFNVQDIAACMPFYTDLLGFSIADPIDFGSRIEDEKIRAGFKDTTGYFMRHGSDHHSFVIFPKPVLDHLGGRSARSDININQITWQVGSLREVSLAEDYLRGLDNPIRRSGRDQPGSNWHVYPFDPDENINELYYGIEQIGWSGHSKPRRLHEKEFRSKPDLPQMSEFAEVERAIASGTDLISGYRHVSDLEAKYDVNGIMLPRPFKVATIGPVRIFVDDVDQSLAFYRDRMGMTVTEEITYNGHRCVFLRVNTEHHSMALYPMALREELGLSPHSTCLSFGMQVGDYTQLRDAVDFFRENKTEIKYLPPELFPGIDYSAFAIDPDGNAIQLYYYMEQIGWDGRPRPPELRRQIDNANWPKSLEPMSDSFGGEVFLGPLG